MKTKLYILIGCAGIALASTTLASETTLNKTLSKIDEAPENSIALEASSEAKLGKLLTKFNSGANVYTITAEGSIDENKKNGIFADLDGLKNGTKIAFGVSRVYYNNSYHFSADAKLRKNCDETILNELSTELYEKVMRCRDKNLKASKVFDKVDAQDSFLRDACKAEYEEQFKLPKSCADYTAKSALPENAQFQEPFWVQIIGFEIAGSNKGYKWLDTTSLAPSDSDKNSYSAEVQYGYINNNYQRFNLGFRYEKSWRGSDEIDVCSPYEHAPASLTCSLASIGAPTQKNSKIVFIEGKTYSGNNDDQAVSARISHDLDSDLTGVEIPYFFWADKEAKSLQGGVKIGWVSDTLKSKNSKSSEVMYSLFFSKNFSVGY